MQLNREMLEGTMPEPAAVFSQAFDNALLHIAQSESKPKLQSFSRRRIAAIVLAAVLALISVLGVAEGIRRTIFAMMAQSQPSEQAAVQPQAEALVRRDLGQLATASLDVRVTEALYDGGTLRLLYTITQRDAPTPLAAADLADPQSPFLQALRQDQVSLTGPDWFELNGEQISMPGGSRPVFAPGDQPGEAVVYLDIKLSAAGLEPEGTFDVGLPLVSGPAAQNRMISFTLKAGQLPGVVNLTPAAAAVRKGVTVTVTDLRLSPIKVYLTYQVDLHDDVPEAAWLETLACWSNAQFVNSAGEVLLPIGVLEMSGLPTGETDVRRHLQQTLEFVSLAAYPDVLYLAPDTPSSSSYLADMTQAIAFSLKEGECK